MKIDGNVFPTSLTEQISSKEGKKEREGKKRERNSLMSEDDFSYVLRLDEKKMFRHQSGLSVLPVVSGVGWRCLWWAVGTRQTTPPNFLFGFSERVN